jgi:hypothetical protein
MEQLFFEIIIVVENYKSFIRENGKMHQTRNQSKSDVPYSFHVTKTYVCTYESPLIN